MKKVGIVSCYFHPNYGSMLQAYATQRILQEWNVPCENIRVDGLQKEIEKSKTKFYLKQIANPQILTGTVLRILKRKFYSKMKHKTLGKNLTLRKACFDQFKDAHFILSPKFLTKQELSDYCHKYACVLIGSDQLWLPSNIDADYYTLSWVPDDVNKVAYATSFGTSFLPKPLQEKAKNFLSRFQYISVRETSGKKMIQEYAGLDVPVVCDPTLLFTAEDWSELQTPDPIVSGPYILCYFLGNNTQDRAFAKRLRSVSGYKIVGLLHLDEYIKADEGYADETPYNIGPAELLNLIKYASYIVTDSFHGSVFSILYRKTFFTSRRVRKSGILCTNTRIDSLFDLVGITGRLIDGSEDVQECIAKTIDYDAVHSHLTEVRAFGREYLKKAIGLAPEV